MNALDADFFSEVLAWFSEFKAVNAESSVISAAYRVLAESDKGVVSAPAFSVVECCSLCVCCWCGCVYGWLVTGEVDAE